MIVLSWMRFLGLEPGDPMPDANTIRVFRERLGQRKTLKKLFQHFDQVLSRAGYAPRRGQIVIAESEEHDYSIGETEFDTTYTNNGWLHRALIHPKNDAYHLVHHMFPNIPERRHRYIHKLLMKHDDKYRSAQHRSSILEKNITNV